MSSQGLPRIEQIGEARREALKSGTKIPSTLRVREGAVHDGLRRELATMFGALPEFVELERNQGELWGRRILGLEIVRFPEDSGNLFDLEAPDMEVL